MTIKDWVAKNNDVKAHIVTSKVRGGFHIVMKDIKSGYGVSREICIDELRDLDKSQYDSYVCKCLDDLKKQLLKNNIVKSKRSMV